MARKPRYHAPRNQAQRLAEAEMAIARLTSTLNTGDNRFGSYGDACRTSIKVWQATADDAKAKIAAGQTKLY
jgi:hypothetical protein